MKINTYKSLTYKILPNKPALLMGNNKATSKGGGITFKQF